LVGLVCHSGWILRFTRQYFKKMKSES
jgi:hypothetical protein